MADELTTVAMPPEGGGDVCNDDAIDRVSVHSLEDATCVNSITSSRPRCLSTSMTGVYEVVTEPPPTSISLSTDRLWNRVLSMTSQDGGGSANHVVRCSRSQENYIDKSDVICVDINIDENRSSSVDALHYNDVVSSDCLSVVTTSVNDDVISDDSNNTCCSDDVFDDVDNDDDNVVDSITLSLISATSVSTVKDADRPSAARLAKRLYNLDGFRRADISPHLTKKNSFSQLVGEEFLKYFDFTGEPLDKALRRFLLQVTVVGDTQECDRLLGHFSKRYHQCNQSAHTSQDCCHTLVCAMLLLNKNLHGSQKGCNRTKISLTEFISNLSGMNNGEDFPRDILKTLYISVKSKPLQSNSKHDAMKSLDPSSSTSTVNSVNKSELMPPLEQRTALLVPTTNNNNVVSTKSSCSVLKKGYVMKKCCFEPEGRKTLLGRRYWKMYYMTLREMTLYFYNDERGFERGSLTTNAIRIEHALASKAVDYTKKKHVFRLQTNDLAQYLIQTSDGHECQDWVDAINLLAACYSSPTTSPSAAAIAAGPGHVTCSTVKSTAGSCNISHRRSSLTTFSGGGGSSSSSRTATTTQRAAHSPAAAAPESQSSSLLTSLSLKDQVERHEQIANQLEQQFNQLRRRTSIDKQTIAVENKLLNDSCNIDNYLRFEIKRYRTYVRLLRAKLSVALSQPSNTCLDDDTHRQHAFRKQTTAPS